MTAPTSPKTPPPAAKKPVNDRKNRLAKALRENLQRRKAPAAAKEE